MISFVAQRLAIAINGSALGGWLADGKVAFYVAHARSNASLESMVRADEAGPELRHAAISAAKHQLATGGQFVSRQSVQLHGGIGVTDEADIGLYFKRMQALSTICGDADFHLQRYAGAAR